MPRRSVRIKKFCFSSTQQRRWSLGERLREAPGEEFQEGEIVRILDGGDNYEVRWDDNSMGIFCSGDVSDMVTYHHNAVTEFNRRENEHAERLLSTTGRGASSSTTTGVYYSSPSECPVQQKDASKKIQASPPPPHHDEPFSYSLLVYEEDKDSSSSEESSHHDDIVTSLISTSSSIHNEEDNRHYSPMDSPRMSNLTAAIQALSLNSPRPIPSPCIRCGGNEVALNNDAVAERRGGGSYICTQCMLEDFLYK